MATSLLFYPLDSGWPTRTVACVSGGYGYWSIQEILGRVIENLMGLRRIEILGHGSPGTMSFGGTGASPGPSSIATSTGLIVHDPGVRSFWMSLRSYLSGGSLVLNACNVGREREGDFLLREVAKLTNATVYGALKDMTSEIGGRHYEDHSLYKRVFAPGRRER